MRDWVGMIRRVEAETRGAVRYDRSVGEDWEALVELMELMVANRVALSPALRTEVAEFYGEVLDDLADEDDDGDWPLLWMLRDTYPRFLAMDPPVPDPRRSRALVA
nr:MAG TPA: hypothetical protein [Caudoviricetes sp.]